jgi:hypothetical protein
MVAPASHKIDPFNSLPVDGGGDTQYLLSECKVLASLLLSASAIDNNTNNHVAYTLFYPTDRPYSTVRPAFGEEEALKKWVTDSSTTHLLLAQVAMTLSSLLSIDLGNSVTYHFGQVITITNKRIANFYRELDTHKDFTIMVVVNLIQFEVGTLPFYNLFLYNS